MLDFPQESASERAARYRTLSDAHARLAARAGDAEAQASHLELAALWRRLAIQAEQTDGLLRATARAVTDNRRGS